MTEDKKFLSRQVVIREKESLIQVGEFSNLLTFLRREFSRTMKNTSANKKQIGSQNPTQNMRYTTKCMTQRAFQKKIVNLIQQACDKVVEAMDIIDEVGAIAGIDVRFERCVERDEQNDHQGKCIDVHDKNYEADEAYDIDEFDEASDEIKEVTLPELADMVAERTCFKPECTARFGNDQRRHVRRRYRRHGHRRR